MARVRKVGVVAGLIFAASLMPALASADSLSVTATVPTNLLSSVPVLRISVPNGQLSAANLPSLTITPPLPTTWSQTGPTSFQAMITGVGFVPMTSYVVQVPTAMTCNSSCSFTSTRSVTLTAAGSLVWLDQLLAEAGYLPVAFSPTSNSPSVTPGTTSTSSTTSTSTSTTTTTLPVFTPSTVTTPLVGTYTWRFPKLPASAKTLWSVGTLNPLLMGAIARFQGERGLPPTGQPSMWTWKLLLGRLAIGKFATGPYAYVDVSETRPETMTLYIDGVVNTVSRANTGIYAAPSTVGSFFVYLKFRSQTMRGTNPDGSKYNDPGVPFVSYYHQSEALHYFTRPGYGWPQSLGCVELPLATAAKIWPLTPIGTVVTVRK